MISFITMISQGKGRFDPPSFFVDKIILYTALLLIHYYHVYPQFLHF
nr:MAG TPA: hypothetical protein [Caudoviricetes sp.]